MVTCITHW